MSDKIANNIDDSFNDANFSTFSRKSQIELLQNI